MTSAVPDCPSSEAARKHTSGARATLGPPSNTSHTPCAGEVLWASFQPDLLSHLLLSVCLKIETVSLHLNMFTLTPSVDLDLDDSGN